MGLRLLVFSVLVAFSQAQVRGAHNETLESFCGAYNDCASCTLSRYPASAKFNLHRKKCQWNPTAKTCRGLEHPLPKGVIPCT